MPFLGFHGFLFWYLQNCLIWKSGRPLSDARGCFVSVRGARAYLRGARAVKWDSRCKGVGYFGCGRTRWMAQSDSQRLFAVPTLGPVNTVGRVRAFGSIGVEKATVRVRRNKARVQLTGSLYMTCWRTHCATAHDVPSCTGSARGDASCVFVGGGRRVRCACGGARCCRPPLELWASACLQL